MGWATWAGVELIRTFREKLENPGEPAPQKPPAPQAFAFDGAIVAIVNKNKKKPRMIYLTKRNYSQLLTLGTRRAIIHPGLTVVE